MKYQTQFGPVLVFHFISFTLLTISLILYFGFGVSVRGIIIEWIALIIFILSTIKSSRIALRDGLYKWKLYFNALWITPIALVLVAFSIGYGIYFALLPAYVMDTFIGSKKYYSHSGISIVKSRSFLTADLYKVNQKTLLFDKTIAYFKSEDEPEIEKAYLQSHNNKVIISYKDSTVETISLDLLK